MTFEFTLPMETAIGATVPFMEQHFGPLTGCRFNDLKAEPSHAIAYGELQASLEGAAEVDLAALLLKELRSYSDSE